MTLNCKKMNTIPITKQQKRKFLTSSLNVSINGFFIEQVCHANIVGVTFDESSSWEPHVNDLCRKLYSHLSLLCSISPYLNEATSIRFNNACLHRQPPYCSSVWQSCSHSQLSSSPTEILSANFTTSSVSFFPRF